MQAARGGVGELWWAGLPGLGVEVGPVGFAKNMKVPSAAEIVGELTCRGVSWLRISERWKDSRPKGDAYRGKDYQVAYNCSKLGAGLSAHFSYHSTTIHQAG